MTEQPTVAGLADQLAAGLGPDGERLAAVFRSPIAKGLDEQDLLMAADVLRARSTRRARAARWVTARWLRLPWSVRSAVTIALPWWGLWGLVADLPLEPSEVTAARGWLSVVVILTLAGGRHRARAEAARLSAHAWGSYAQASESNARAEHMTDLVRELRAVNDTLADTARTNPEVLTPGAAAMTRQLFRLERALAEAGVPAETVRAVREAAVPRPGEWQPEPADLARVARALLTEGHPGTADEVVADAQLVCAVIANRVPR